jgi:hypothetical protein
MVTFLLWYFQLRLPALPLDGTREPEGRVLPNNNNGNTPASYGGTSNGSARTAVGVDVLGTLPRPGRCELQDWAQADKLSLKFEIGGSPIMFWTGFYFTL